MKDWLSLESFYDGLSDEYNSAILRCVPRYHEMLWALLRYVREGLDPKNILELGCGSGNLTQLLLARFPEAKILGTDISSEMIERCRRRFKSERLTLERIDFRNLRLSPESFDLVASSISVHHIDDQAKRTLFKMVYESLGPGGVFSYSDQCAGTNAEIYHKHIQQWKEESVALGVTPEEWETWMRHQEEHDHHASLPDQLLWLKEAGFKLVDCPWRYLLWTVIYAEK